MFLTLVSVYLVTVYGKDPTKVCLPKVFQTGFFSLTTKDNGIIAFDFLQQLIGRQTNNGARNVFDLAAGTVALINDKDNSCVRITLPDALKTANSQCLPPDAKLLTHSDTPLDLDWGSLKIEAWEFEIPMYGKATVVLTKHSPTLPLLRQLTTGDPNTSDITVFFTPKLSVDDPNIFNIPDVCPFKQ